MWLMTKHGMYSVVNPESDASKVLVRARVRKDLERLQRALPEPLRGKYRIIKTEQRDYGYRLVMPQTEFALLVFKLANEIDYTNFKEEVAKRDPRRAAVYGRIWGILLQLQKFGWWSRKGVDSFPTKSDDPSNAARSRDF